MFNQPLISCVMLTANRPQFTPCAVACFLNQQWPNKELVVYDTGKVPAAIANGPNVHVYRGLSAPIGTMRNCANALSKGRIIANWDDDDWYCPRRLEHQFETLATYDADIVGYRTVYFRQERKDESAKYWLYYGDIDPTGRNNYAMASSMMYKRVAWENRPFRPVMVAEELEFVANRKVIISDGHDPVRMIARHHAGSTSQQRYFSDDPGGSWRSVSQEISASCEILLNSTH